MIAVLVIKKVFKVSSIVIIVTLVLIMINWLFFFEYWQKSSIKLPSGLNRVPFIISSASSYTGSDVNLYEANEEELKKISRVRYDEEFGFVPNEKTAIDIAIIVLNEVYGDCNRVELPFVIKYNSNADTWIVHGTLPILMAGGTGFVGIKKSTGEVILISHSK